MLLKLVAETIVWEQKIWVPKVWSISVLKAKETQVTKSKLNKMHGV